MRTSRWKRLAAAVLAAAAAGGLAAPALGATRLYISKPRVPAKTVGALEVDQALYWDGRRVVGSGTQAGAGVAPNPLCGVRAVRCFDYRLALARGGAQLRVAIDHPGFGDLFSIELYDPQGRFVDGASTDATQYAAPTDLRATGVVGAAFDQAPIPGGGYSAEVFVKRPAAGTWTVRAVANRVADSSFRLRAKLERRTFADGRVTLQPPDLRMTPPFQVTFAAPAGSAGSCTLDEQVDYGARRCLRFSLGPENAGPGMLDLRSEPGKTAQRVYRSDGTYEERDAGELEGLLELYAVLDARRGEMRLVGKGPKQGYCTAPHRIAEWERFNQSANGTAPHDCAAQGAAVGLEVGWGHVHLWSLPGNYVEFGDENPDALYVVRARADGEGRLFEAREDNNDAYAYIDVNGDSVEVIERGYGTSPWDPRKVVANDGLAPVG